MKVVTTYKYLGAETGHSIGAGRWNLLLQRLWRKATGALNLLLFRRGGSAGLSPTLLKRLWVAECRPLLEYGCELWEGYLPEVGGQV